MTLYIRFLAGLLIATAFLSRPASAFDPDEFEKAYSSGKLPTPDSLDDFKAQIAWMRQHGAKASQIAEHMSRVIDQRLDASNQLRGGESIFNPFKKGPVKDRVDRWKAFERALDPELGMPGRGIDDGLRYEHAAKAAWENRVGNCNASASLAYYILKESGVDSRMLTSSAGGGHEFVVIGLPPDADVNDPSTWGENARVVDGWYGRSLTPAEARENRHHFEGTTTGSNGSPKVIDSTRVYDNLKANKAWEEMGEKGCLTVFVKGPDGKAVPGVTVTLSSQEAQSATTDGSGMARFMSYPGSVTATASVAKDSGLKGASASAQVQTKGNVEVTISLGGRADLGEIRELIQEARKHEEAAAGHLVDVKEKLAGVDTELGEMQALKLTLQSAVRAITAAESSRLQEDTRELGSTSQVAERVSQLQSKVESINANARLLETWAGEVKSTPRETVDLRKTKAEEVLQNDEVSVESDRESWSTTERMLETLDQALKLAHDAEPVFDLASETRDSARKACDRARALLIKADQARSRAAAERDSMRKCRDDAAGRLAGATSEPEISLLAEAQALGGGFMAEEFAVDLRRLDSLKDAEGTVRHLNVLQQGHAKWMESVAAVEAEVEAVRAPISQGRGLIQELQNALVRERNALGQLLGGTQAGLVRVPGVVTLKASEARFDLQGAGFKVDLQRSKDKAPEPEDDGTVASQSPAKGAWAKKGSVVTVFVYGAGDAGGAAKPESTLAGHWGGVITTIEDSMFPENVGPAGYARLDITMDPASVKLIVTWNQSERPTWRVEEKSVEILPGGDSKWKGTLTRSDDGNSLTGTIEYHIPHDDGRDQFIRQKIELSKGR